MRLDSFSFYLANRSLKEAIRDLRELAHDVDKGLHIPVKYRKIPLKQFLEVERPKFVAYLKKEIATLENLTKGAKNESQN